MRPYDSATLDALAEPDTVVGVLLWIEAMDGDTPAPAGFWSGEDDRSFTIGGDARTYAGGVALEVDPIRSAIGLDVRMQRVSLSLAAPEVALALKGRRTRFVRAEIHRALFSPLSGALVAEPHRLFLGTVDQVDLTSGDEPQAVLTLASPARGLTRPLQALRSDAAMQRRNPGDRFRQYTALENVRVAWGEALAAPPQQPTSAGEPATPPIEANWDPSNK